MTELMQTILDKVEHDKKMALAWGEEPLNKYRSTLTVAEVEYLLNVLRVHGIIQG